MLYVYPVFRSWNSQTKITHKARYHRCSLLTHFCVLCFVIETDITKGRRCFFLKCFNRVSDQTIRHSVQICFFFQFQGKFSQFLRFNEAQKNDLIKTRRRLITHSCTQKHLARTIPATEYNFFLSVKKKYVHSENSIETWHSCMILLKDTEKN